MILGVLPILILIISLLSPKNKETEKVSQMSSQLFIILSTIVIMFFVGLRNRYTGSADTSNYARIFERIIGTSFSKTVMPSGTTIRDLIFEEGGFTIYMWALAQIFNSAQPFIFISTAITTILVARFIYKHSEDATVSWIVYICLGLMTFNMNGMRQSLAMAICLVSYDFVKEKKFFKFSLTVFIAFLFHKTSFVFLLVYPLYNYKPSGIKDMVIAGLTGLFLIFSRQLAAMYDEWAGKDYATAESFEGGGGVVVAIYLLLIALCVVYVCFAKRKDSAEVRNLGILLGAGFIFYISRYFSTQMFERVSYYFFYFSLLLFPKLIDLFDEDSKPLYRVILICLAIVLFFYRISRGAFGDFTFF